MLPSNLVEGTTLNFIQTSILHNECQIINVLDGGMLFEYQNNLKKEEVLVKYFPKTHFFNLSINS